MSKTKTSTDFDVEAFDKKYPKYNDEPERVKKYIEEFILRFGFNPTDKEIFNFKQAVSA